jgi:hypothetical protein
MPKAPIFLNETTARRHEDQKNTSNLNQGARKNPPEILARMTPHKPGKGTRTGNGRDARETDLNGVGGERQESKSKRTKKRGSRQADKRERSEVVINEGNPHPLCLPLSPLMTE